MKIPKKLSMFKPNLGFKPNSSSQDDQKKSRGGSRNGTRINRLGISSGINAGHGGLGGGPYGGGTFH